MVDKKLLYTNEYKIKGIVSTKSINRVTAWFKYRSILMFSICRKEIFFKSLSFVPSKQKRSLCPHLNISSGALPNMIMAYFGMFKKLNIPYLVRVIGHKRVDAAKKIDLKSTKYLFKTLIKLLGPNINKKKEDFFYEKINDYRKRDVTNKRTTMFYKMKVFISFVFSIFFLDKILKKIFKKFFVTKFSIEYIFHMKNRNLLSFRNILNHL